jgi:hypothetical protein
MIDQRPGRLPAHPPSMSPPRPFVERRVSYRRAEDRIAHREKVLLARALDILASDESAEERLAGLLRLLARTAGARRAAVIADGFERRAAVAVDPDEDPATAEALAGWLDVHAPRTQARRAAAGRAPISFVIAAVPRPADGSDEAPASPDALPDEPTGHYAVLPIPGSGDVALGFEFRRPADAERLAGRRPPTRAR